MRDPNVRLPRKIGGQTWAKSAGSQAPAAKSPPIPIGLVGVLNEDGSPDLKELEKRGLLRTFLRNWNTPASLSQLKAVAERMRADGVDRKDSAVVKAWGEKHKDELDSGSFESGAAAVQKPVVNSGPSAGRNDPCPCGSKKKFKKCCAGK